MGLRPISSGAVRPPLAPMLRAAMGWIDGWASGHNPLRPSQGLEGIMIRCVGAALRGDGNPPEVPVIRTVLRAYNGVWGVPIKHMSAALCARTNAVLAERLCEAKYSELYLPEGALIKDGLRPSVSAPFLRQRIYTLIRRKV